MTPTAAPPDSAEIGAIIRANLHLEGPLLPILHDLQAAFGHIPDAARAPVAEALNITPAELHGVITFYHDFRRRRPASGCSRSAAPRPARRWGDAWPTTVLEIAGLDWHDTRRTGAVTVEPVYCLGLCACAPAAMVDGQVRGRVTAEALVAEVAASEGLGSPRCRRPGAGCRCRGRGLRGGGRGGGPQRIARDDLAGAAGGDRAGRRAGRAMARPAAADVARILDGTAESLGPVEADPVLRPADPPDLPRCGVIDPLSLADYEAHGGLRRPAPRA